MRWVEPTDSAPLKASVLAQLARKAALERPDSPHARLALADKEFLARNYARAAELYAEVGTGPCASEMAWHKLARSHLELGDPNAALLACQRGFEWSDEADFALSVEAGLASRALGKGEEARRHFLEAAEAGNHHDACWFILFDLARKHDAAAILRECDKLEARFGQSSVFRANRAIAYSMLGEEAAARALVDLEKHVRTGSVREFFDGDLAELNAALSQEAMAIGADSGSDTKAIVPNPDLSGAPTMRFLRSLLCQAVEVYLSEAAQRDLDECLPLPLGDVSLRSGATLLRQDASNGQHIHRTSVISIVYHVNNPSKGAAGENAGALQIGPVDQYAGGHRGCWGERLILPEPGQLTIFPAHFFHDVVPTRSDELRISVPADVYIVA